MTDPTDLTPDLHLPCGCSVYHTVEDGLNVLHVAPCQADCATLAENIRHLPLHIAVIDRRA